jgi:gliding motility-associated-like protein
MKKIFLSAWVTMLSVIYCCNNLYAQLVSDNVFMQGQWLESAIAPNGSWGMSVTPPAGYHTHSGGSTGGYTDPITGTAYFGSATMDFEYNYAHDAWVSQWGPYFLPGTPFDGWSMQVNGIHSNAYYTDYGFYNDPGGTLTGACTGYTNTGGTITGIWTGSAGPGSCISIRQENRVDTFAAWVSVTTVFKNTGATALPGLYYFVTGDPDNDEPYSGGSFPTNNFINWQGGPLNQHMVGSVPPSIHPTAFSSLATKDCRAKALIYQSWPPSVTPGNNLDLVWAQTETGMGTTYYNLHDETLSQDIAMGLIYNLGTLGAGDSTILSFAWIFKDSTCIDSAFPEPNIVVDGVPGHYTAPPPAPIYDTFTGCSHLGLNFVPVNLIHASDKCWSWSTWTWSPSAGLASTTGVNNIINMAAVPGQTTYTIVGTDSTVGMQSCANRIIYLTVIPCFGAINNGPICKGDTLRLDAIGDSTGATYAWFNPAGVLFSTAHHVVIPDAAYSDSGVYVVVRTIGSSHDTARTDVTIHWKPVLTLSQNTPLCYGVVDTLHLTAVPDSVGEIFSWTGPIAYTATGANPTRAPFTTIDTGIYTVIATSGFGCKDTASIDVVQTPQPPPPVITGVTTYCTGEAFVPFVVSATGTVIWYNSSTGGVGSTVAPVLSTAAGGVYTFWASQVVGGCESLRDSIVVTIHVTPNAPSITGTTIYCQFYTYIPPTATPVPPTATYENILWYTVPTGGIGSPTVPTLSTLIPGVYTIYANASDSGCTSPMSSFSILVNPKPVPPVEVDIPDQYCPGAAFVPFTILSGDSIKWYPAAVGGAGSMAQPTPNMGVPGVDTFWATQTVLNCESDRSFVTIHVYDSVIANFTDAIKLGCEGDTVKFSNFSTGAIQYLWEFGDGNSDTSTAPTHVYMTQGTFNVTMYATSTTCIDSFHLSFTTHHPLSASYTVSDSVICQNVTDVFTNTSIVTAPGHYSYNFGDGSPADTNQIATHSFALVGTYSVTLTATDSIRCSAQYTTVVTVDTNSQVTMAVSDTVLCGGNDATFTATYATEGNLGIRWIFGNGDSSINANPVAYSYGSGGVYTVTAIALYRACENTSVTKVIHIYNHPEIDLGGDTGICPGSTPIILIDLLNSSASGATWLWNTGQTSNNIAVGAPGVYKVTVTVNGCTASDSVSVSSDCYMDVPNIFSPNGDGLNDYFYPRQYLTKGLTSFKMDIYNRWGELIFESASLDGRGWDGKFNAIDQPEGVYIYIIEGTFKDGRTEHHQGNITLLR